MVLTYSCFDFSGRWPAFHIQAQLDITWTCTHELASLSLINVLYNLFRCLISLMQLVWVMSERVQVSSTCVNAILSCLMSWILLQVKSWKPNVEVKSWEWEIWTSLTLCMCTKLNENRPVECMSMENEKEILWQYPALSSIQIRN